MSRDEYTNELITVSDKLGQAYLVLPTLLEAKHAAHHAGFNDAIAEGHNVSFAREYAAQCSAVHTTNHERARAEIANLQERVALLRFLLEHSLTS